VYCFLVVRELYRKPLKDKADQPQSTLLTNL